MGTDDGTWGQSRQERPAGSAGTDLSQLVRTWFRRVECPTCQVGVGRACRTSGGRPTNHHRARQDAAGRLPYEQWRQQGLLVDPPPVPAIVGAAHKARADYHVDQARGDAIAVMQMVLADRYGIALGDTEVWDRVDDAVRQLLAVRGPEASADLVTVLAGLIATLLGKSAGAYGDVAEAFDLLIRTQLAEARIRQRLDKQRSHG